MTSVASGGVLIKPATAAHAQAVADIYNHFVNDTIVTFEEEPVTAAVMAGRIERTGADASLPFVVAEQAGRVVGYALAGKWKGRCGYRYTVESAVYVDVARTGQGFGSLLYEGLLAELRRLGVHVVIGGIALPNAASVALHEKFGFDKVAHFREVGFKLGRWIDTGYWQLTLSPGWMPPT